MQFVCTEVSKRPWNAACSEISQDAMKQMSWLALGDELFVKSCPCVRLCLRVSVFLCV